MKKSLFAIAAVTAFAGAAQAQSSVTVYGLIDFGYAGASQVRAGPGTTLSSTSNGGQSNNIVTKTQTSGIAGDGESTSRLGFRGNEDLGGGLNAFFTAEAAINMAATGNSNASGLLSATSSGQRQLFVGLGKKGLGAASFGTQYTPIHEAVTSTNAGGANNQMGDVIYDRRGNGVDYTQSGMSTNDSYTVRSTNALILKSERMAGFGFKGMLVATGRTANQTSGASANGGESSNEGYGIGADYQWQKLYVTANYQMFRNNTSTGAAAVSATNLTPALAAQATTFTPGYNGGAVTPGVNAQDSQQYYGATYDFGILKAFAGYVNRKVTNIAVSTNYVSRTAQQIGVRAPITPAIQVWASGGTGKINNNGIAGTAANITGWQIGSDYNLSKRTNLYAIYGNSATSNVNMGAYAATTTSSAMTSYNQASYAVGVRHTF
jgi:predicted porin